MSLADDLASKENKITDSSASWRHFVKDFKELILATSRVEELTPYQQRIFKYRLRDYLASIKITTDLTWVIIWLNQLETELNFFNKHTLIIPNYQTLQKIRAMYDGSN